jgi:predicted nucleic-acid-binding Zn-ribbon protein
MKTETKTITCPKCGAKQEFTLYKSINASNEELKDKFIDGSLTTLVCSNCGFSGVVEYPILYHDLNEKFSIFFDPDSTDREAQLPNVLPSHLLSEISMRLVHTQDEMREKIYIFRDKLDDRIIELLKDSILREMEAKKEKIIPETLFYAQDMFECEGRSLIFVPRLGTEYLDPIKVPFATYEKIKMLMHGIWERPVAGYTVVDKEWIRV